MDGDTKGQSSTSSLPLQIHTHLVGLDIVVTVEAQRRQARSQVDAVLDGAVGAVALFAGVWAVMRMNDTKHIDSSRPLHYSCPGKHAVLRGYSKHGDLSDKKQNKRTIAAGGTLQYMPPLVLSPFMARASSLPSAVYARRQRRILLGDLPASTEGQSMPCPGVCTVGGIRGALCV